jgi:Domain of unknown function (DUF4331)
LKETHVSHHFDSPTAIADGRINLCDLFVFPGGPGTTTLILTVNPDAGRSSATTFRPDALYEFVVASDGGTREDIAFRITFTEPDDAGNQQMRVLRAGGTAARHGTEGTVLGEGRTGEVFPLGAGGLAWAGLAADPFTADGIALARFLAGLAAGQYDPGVFTSSPGNIFAGRDVTAVALQVPDADLGGTRIAVWARISLVGHAPQLQVSRIGQAMLRPLFFSPPDAESETLNAGAPAGDRDAHGKRVLSIASAAARLAGLADPEATPSRCWRRSYPTWSATSPVSPPPSNRAVATGAHLTTTPSTSPWPSWPGRRSETPPSHGRPPRSSLTCQRPARRSCRPSPTSSASASKDRNSTAPTRWSRSVAPTGRARRPS